MALGGLGAANKDWDVWTAWYEDRLVGRVREYARELAYVEIDEALWNQGPAAVNAAIKKRIEEFEQKLPIAASPLVTKAGANPPPIAAPPPPSVEASKTIPPATRKHFTGFFSYAHIDARVDPHIVEAFTARLEERVDAQLINASFEIWRDQDNLRVGDRWDPKIQGAVHKTDVFIVLLTPKWISSDYCRKEFGHFEEIETSRNSGSYIIPIYARDLGNQERFLDDAQKALLQRLKQIQYQQIIPKEFARLSNLERIDLLEKVADPIVAMINRLRG